MKKISEIFEGKDSSLYKTYRESVKSGKTGNSREKIRTSERAELIRDILELVNKEREGTKYKPMTGVQLAIKLSHLKEPDLYFILSMSKDCKNRNYPFSKWLFGSIKPKK